MRYFFAKSLVVLAFILGATGAAPVAHAQATGNPGDPCNLSEEFGGGLGKFGPDGIMCVPNAAVAVTTDNTPGAVVNTAAQTAAANTNTDFSTGDKDNEAFNIVMQKIMILFAWLVGVAAITLDNAVYYTVVAMGGYIKDLTAIGVTWRILRDIGNIMLIFGFLAIGITTVLNVDWYGDRKKMLPMMLVAAVFLNFSLFFAEAIIDGGNLFATQFYTQINGGQPAGAKNFDLASVGNDGISNKIMSQLGLQTMYGEVRTKPELLKGASSWIVGFMGILLFIVTAFVMFSLAFVLIARFIFLIFLIILAPVGFAGLAVPQLAGKAKQWWDSLFQQTLTAPVLLLMLYVALAVITDARFLTGLGGSSASWTGFVDGKNLTGFGSMILSFIVAMGLLIAVTVAAKKLSAFGAGWATGTAGKLTFGATAWAGRTTVGWGASRAAKTLRGTAFARVPLVGTGVVKGLEKVATGSFDVRGTGALKSFPGGGVDAGAAQKGGYRADLKGRVESRTKYAKDLTGRELTEEEKIDQSEAQKTIKASQKNVAELQLRKRTMTESEAESSGINAQLATAKTEISTQQEKLEKIESVTDKGAQRKYASVLELGLGEKSIFNKYINFAANTEAAKKIRGEAKKSSDEKTLDALKAALKKSEGGEAPAAPAPAPAAGGH